MPGNEPAAPQSTSGSYWRVDSGGLTLVPSQDVQAAIMDALNQLHTEAGLQPGWEPGRDGYSALRVIHWLEHMYCRIAYPRGG